MKNKLMLLTAASAFSMAGIAADYTNIVLINLDDVGYGDFSFNGAYGYTTPNIDKMAAEGIRFTHFLVGQPISGASRAGLLTAIRIVSVFPALRGQIRTTVSIQRR